MALGTQAEQHFAADPNVTLYKLRQFCEVLAKRAAAKVGLLLDPREELRRVIDALSDRGAIGAVQRDLFHQLRRTGNDAVHDLAGTQAEALHQLKVAHQLAIWFQRSFGNNRKFDPGPYVPPQEPKQADSALHEELARLRKEAEDRAQELEAARLEIEDARRIAEAELASRTTAEQREQKAREEAAIWEALAAEQVGTEAGRSKALEEQNRKLLAELAASQAYAQAIPVREVEQTVQRAAAASDATELDEAATRRIIDRQLREAGWEADSDPALLVVTQRPRELTREDLRQLKVALDQEGFTEKALQAAWTESKNEDFAATIIGYIRQLALGSPLVPYAERVDHALQRLRQKHQFTDPQRKWLDRIGTQMKHETVVDKQSLDQGQLKAGGGFVRLNKVFDGKLESLLGELAR